MRNPMSAHSNFQLPSSFDMPNFMSTIQPRIEDDDEDQDGDNRFV